MNNHGTIRKNTQNKSDEYVKDGVDHGRQQAPILLQYEVLPAIYIEEERQNAIPRIEKELEALWLEECKKYEQSVRTRINGAAIEMPRRNYPNRLGVVQDDTLFPYHNSCYPLLDAYDCLYSSSYTTNDDYANDDDNGDDEDRGRHIHRQRRRQRELQHHQPQHHQRQPHQRQRQRQWQRREENRYQFHLIEKGSIPPCDYAKYNEYVLYNSKDQLLLFQYFGIIKEQQKPQNRRLMDPTVECLDVQGFMPNSIFAIIISLGLPLRLLPYLCHQQELPDDNDAMTGALWDITYHHFRKQLDDEIKWKEGWKQLVQYNKSLSATTGRNNNDNKDSNCDNYWFNHALFEEYGRRIEGEQQQQHQNRRYPFGPMFFPKNKSDRGELLLKLLRHSMSDLQRDMRLSTLLLHQMASFHELDNLATLRKLLIILKLESITNCDGYCHEEFILDNINEYLSENIDHGNDLPDHFCYDWSDFTRVAIPSVITHGITYVTTHHASIFVAFVQANCYPKNTNKESSKQKNDKQKTNSDSNGPNNTCRSRHHNQQQVRGGSSLQQEQRTRLVQNLTALRRNLGSHCNENTWSTREDEIPWCVIDGIILGLGAHAIMHRNHLHQMLKYILDEKETVKEEEQQQQSAQQKQHTSPFPTNPEEQFILESIQKSMDSFYSCARVLIEIGNLFLDEDIALPLSAKTRTVGTLLFKTLCQMFLLKETLPCALDNILWDDIKYETMAMTATQATEASAAASNEASSYLGLKREDLDSQRLIRPCRYSNIVTYSTERKLNSINAIKSLQIQIKNSVKIKKYYNTNNDHWKDNANEENYHENSDSWTIVLTMAHRLLYDPPCENVREMVKALFVRELVDTRSAGCGYGDFLVWCGFDISPYDPVLFWNSENIPFDQEIDDYIHGQEYAGYDYDDNNNHQNGAQGLQDIYNYLQEDAEYEYDDYDEYEPPPNEEITPNDDGIDDDINIAAGWDKNEENEYLDCYGLSTRHDFSLMLLLRAWNAPWNPSSHHSFQIQFRQAVKTLFLCNQRFGLPKEVGQQICEYLHREWWHDNRKQCWCLDCQVRSYNPPNCASLKTAEQELSLNATTGTTTRTATAEACMATAFASLDSSRIQTAGVSLSNRNRNSGTISNDNGNGRSNGIFKNKLSNVTPASMSNSLNIVHKFDNTVGFIACKCNVAIYCSKEHKQQNYKDGHKQVCRKPPFRTPGPEEELLCREVMDIFSRGQDSSKEREQEMHKMDGVTKSGELNNINNKFHDRNYDLFHLQKFDVVEDDDHEKGCDGDSVAAVYTDNAADIYEYDNYDENDDVGPVDGGSDDSSWEDIDDDEEEARAHLPTSPKTPRKMTITDVIYNFFYKTAHDKQHTNMQGAEDRYLANHYFQY